MMQRNARPCRGAILPALIGVLFALMVTLDLNGSSMAVLSSERPAEGLLWGTPRSIRSDEYQLRTPIALSATLQGFPDRPWIGLVRTDQTAAAHGGPTREWPTLFKPQDWGYLVLGASRGLAFSWWWSFAVCLAGCYALLFQLTRRHLLSSALAIAATFTPYAAWWSSPPPSLFLGYAALTGFFLLLAWSSESTKRAAVFSLLAAGAGTALILALYPPWQVSLAWVVVALCLGHALDSRFAIRRMLWTTALTTVAAAGTVLAWALQHRDAIEAVSATLYPGQRVTRAGTGSLAVLANAPLNFWMTRAAGASMGTEGRGGHYANLSEAASSWFSLPLVTLAALSGLMILASRLINRGAPSSDHHRPAEAAQARATGTWTLIATSLVAILLLAWTLLPLPDWLGTITLLNRVQPTRTSLALGFVQIALIAVIATLPKHSRPFLLTWPWLVAAALGMAALTAWSAQELPWDASLANPIYVVISGLIIGGLLSWVAGPRASTTGSIALAAVALASWAPVNPLQQGTAPLTQDPVTVELRALTGADTNPRVVVFGDFSLTAKVRAAGLQSVSGTTLYPDADLMEQLAPGQEQLWNNYAQYRWVPAKPGSVAAITQLRGTVMELSIAACDPVLLTEVDPGWVLSDSELDDPCLRPASTVNAGGRQFWVYRVT